MLIMIPIRHIVKWIHYLSKKKQISSHKSWIYLHYQYILVSYFNIFYWINSRKIWETNTAYIHSLILQQVKSKIPKRVHTCDKCMIDLLIYITVIWLIYGQILQKTSSIVQKYDFGIQVIFFITKTQWKVPALIWIMEMN